MVAVLLSCFSHFIQNYMLDFGLVLGTLGTLRLFTSEHGFISNVSLKKKIPHLLNLLV